MRDIALFKNWKNSLEIQIGFSNLKHYHNQQALEKIKPIITLKILKQHGVQVKAFISPVLPGITNVEEILVNIDPDIPVFLDKLRIDDHNRETCLEYIKNHYPTLKSIYKRITYDGVDNYYLELCKNKKIIDRCTFTFFDSYE